MADAGAVTTAKDDVDFTSLLEPGNFVTRFAAGDSRNRCVNRLHALLSKIDPEATFAAQAEWLEDMAAWLFQKGHTPNRRANEPESTSRLRLMLDAFDEIPERKTALRAVVVEAFSALDPVHLFTDTGLPSQHGIFTEAFDRVMKSVLPEPPVENDAGRLLHRLFPDADRAGWFDSLDPALMSRLFDTLAVPQAAALTPALVAMRDASVLLSVRIAATGTSDEVRERSTGSVHESPFLYLPQTVRQLLADPTPDQKKNTTCREALAACRKETARIVSTLDATGISLNLVYQLDYVRHLLDRLYMLLGLIAPATGQPAEGLGFRLVQLLIRGGIRDRSLYELFRRNSLLLARRIIERAGRSGEHYITRTRSEWHHMVGSASGGGAMTSGSILLKFFITWAKLPLLFEGLALSLDYAGSFVIMQMVGFTLATKQPSMTAAALAHSIKETETSTDLAPLVDQVVRTVRSQLAAAIGNVGMVIPVAFATDMLVRGITGHHILGHDYAEHLIESHHPLKSFTVMYAAITGCFLWLASVAGGAVENWFVVTKLPHSIASNRWLRSFIGSHRSQGVAQYLYTNISGLSVGVALGLLLGLVPMAFSLIGIHIEVRHVTFATGQLVYAGMERGVYDVLNADYVFALSGILLIGTMNFGVSFALALAVAFRARDVRPPEQIRLLWAVLKRFRQHPLDFVRAPKSTAL